MNNARNREPSYNHTNNLTDIWSRYLFEDLKTAGYFDVGFPLCYMFSFPDSVALPRQILCTRTIMILLLMQYSQNVRNTGLAIFVDGVNVLKKERHSVFIGGLFMFKLFCLNSN